MEQFRKMGEAMGSMRALMVLQDESFQINRRQCSLLYDIFNLAFDRIADEIKQTRLKLDEKRLKALEHPLKEIYKVFKDGESYIRGCCMEPVTKESSTCWAAHALILHENRDCVEFHIHNLFCYFPIVIETIETSTSEMDLDEMQMRRIMVAKKYDQVWNDPKLFQWNYGKQYLVTDEILRRLDTAWQEDRWLLVETVNSRSKHRRLSSHHKHEQRVGEMLIKKLNGSALVFPSSLLTGGLEFQVKRRLGKESQYREIHWMGDNFMMRRLQSGEMGTDQTLETELTQVLSLSHPNVVQYLCGFHDEEKKEYMFITELMTKDLNTHIKDLSGPKKRLPFTLPVAVDIMLQIARGMEYLHSQKIYHGELNPTNILIKMRHNSSSLSDGSYVHAKISGFDFKSLNKSTPTPRASISPSAEKDESSLTFIWYAPEVLCEQEKPGRVSSFKYTEKADIYSYGMLCFELLTGKVPFEDGHLQGDKMSRNIRAGERPLFPFSLPKCLSTLTKKCWQTDAEERPSFSTICRILRYIRRLMVMNNYLAFPEIPAQHADVFEIDAILVKKLSPTTDLIRPVWEIPYEHFAYRLAEKDRLNGDDQNTGNNNSECDHEATNMPPTTGNAHHIENTAAGAAALSDLEQQQFQSLKPNHMRSVDSNVMANKRVSHPPSVTRTHSMGPEHDSLKEDVLARSYMNGPLPQEKKKTSTITSRFKRSVSVSASSSLHSLFPGQDSTVSVSSDQVAARGSPLRKSSMGSEQLMEIPERKPFSLLSKQSWSATAEMQNATKGAKPLQANKKKGPEKSAWYNRIRKHVRS